MNEEFPSVSKQFDNLSKFVFEMASDVVSGDFNVFVDKESQENRKKLCETCEFLQQSSVDVENVDAG